MRFINALVASAVIAITSSSVLAQSTAVQWTTASGGNGHWYSVRVFTSELTPSEYFDLATAIGGYGASITNQAEDEFVYQLSVATPGGWSVCGLGPLLGGGRLSGCNFTWLTGEPWGYTSWGPADPSHCGEQFLQYCVCGQSSECARRWWIDTDMTVKPSGVIEWSADCNGDGIVDYGQCLNGTLPDYNGNNIPDCCERGEVCVTGNYPVQWRVADGGNGHWYQLRIRSSVVPWSSAATESVASAGHLASILSEAEDIFTFNVANHPGAWQGYLGPWLGGRQVPGTGEPLGIWEWSSGEPWGYVGPDSSFPNNGGPPGTDENRLHYIDFVRKWNDIPENGCPENGGGVRAMIVEWEADCNNDGVVDYGQILSGQLIDADANGIPDDCQTATKRLVPQQYATIQAAVNAAVAGDTVLITGGSYSETVNTLGKSILVSALVGSGDVLLSAPDNQRSIRCISGETSACVIRGIHFVSTSAKNVVSGGIHIANASPRVENCWIDGVKSAITIGSWGGAVDVVSGNPRFVNCLFEHNQVVTTTWADGGAFVVRSGSTVLEGCTFRDNSSGQGSDLFINGNPTASATLFHCTFTGASGNGFGARIYNYGPGDGSVVVNLNDCDFSAISQSVNSLVHGWDSVNMTRTRFENCATGQSGALISQHRSQLILSLCDFANNSVGALVSVDPTQGGTAIISTSSFCGNTPMGPSFDNILLDGGGNSVSQQCCVADISGNGEVNGVDLAELLNAWGTDGQGEFDADIDDDGIVAGSDLGFVLSGWGTCPN